MSEPAETRESLLLRLADPNCQDAWSEFNSIYHPMVLRLARRSGLQEHDAQDVTQQVMMTVMRAIGQWRKDPARGRFRGWLSTVTRNAIRNAIARRPKDRAVGSTELMPWFAASAGDSELDQIIEDEFLRTVLREAARRIRHEFEPSTWDAFWLTVADGQSVESASNQLSMSRGAIYSARSRIMRRLQIVASEILSEDVGDD